MSVKHILPHANIAPLIAACPVALAPFAHDMGAQALRSNTDTTDADLVKDAHSRGLPIRVYTVKQAADLLRLKHIDVDAVFVNDVAWARKVLATAS
jgi:glycerophosphoryl diester phosphodiesterase